MVKTTAMTMMATAHTVAFGRNGSHEILRDERETSPWKHKKFDTIATVDLLRVKRGGLTVRKETIR